MYTLLIPKDKSKKETKTGGGPFWKSYWEVEVEKDKKYYSSQYEKRISGIQLSLGNFTKQYNAKDKRYYAEIKLDERASSKSNNPTKLWQKTGLRVVGSRSAGSNTFLTVNGLPQDFKKFDSFVKSSSFEKALSPIGSVRGLSREIFAVTAIRSKNDSIKNRVSNQLFELIKDNYSQKLECTILIHYDQELSQYDNIYNKLSEEIGGGNLRKRDTDFFITNMSYRASLTIDQIQRILSDVNYNFIDRIKLVPEFTAQRSTPNLTPKNIKIGKFMTDEIVALIDGGIKNILLQSLIAHSKNYLKSNEIPVQNHGTNVASRLLFGNKFFETIESGHTINPSAKIVDIRVLHLKNDIPVVDMDVLMKSIQESVKGLSYVTLYNLSIADSKPADEQCDVDECTALIDTLSNQHDVLFVLAVGNDPEKYHLDYEKIFEHPSYIAPPSDAINALSVGSIAEIATHETICEKIDHPSPFTRRGGLRKDMKKPEVVAYGGNVKKDPRGEYNDLAHDIASRNNYGVEVIGADKFGRDVGTSLSAPIITREAVLVLDYLRKSNLPEILTAFDKNKANLIKALLVHSTAENNQASISSDSVKRAYGFGIPSSQKALLDDTKDQVKIVYADTITSSEQKHKLLLKLPTYLLGASVEFHFTLVYNPPVNINFEEYMMVNLQCSLKTILPEIKNGQPTGQIMKIQSLTPAHSWENYKHKHFNTIHFKKTIKKLKYLDLQIGIQMTVSEYLLEELGGGIPIEQNYALVLSIKDKGSDNKLRDELLQTNKFIELVRSEVEIPLQ